MASPRLNVGDPITDTTAIQQPPYLLVYLIGCLPTKNHLRQRLSNACD
jgi:hypothetical protein